MSKSVLNQIRQLTEPIVLELGLEMVDVEYVKEGSQWYLRVFIDKEGGVDIDDCVAASRKISALLDRDNTITQAYTLEVSSPGIERPLRKKEDYLKYKGELISVYTVEKHEGFTQFTGVLQGLENGVIQLEYEGKTIAVPWDLVERAHLTFEF